MAISNILNQPQYYQGLDLNSLANGKKPNMTSAITGKPAVGVISTTPKSTVSSSTKPSAAPSPSSSMGTYKGVSITPGTDAQIQAQMRSIDNPAPTRGLFPSVSSSLSSSITTPRTLKTGEEENKPATYPSILEDLIGRATNSDAITKATQDLTAFRQGTSQKIADIKSQAVPLEFQQGRAQVVQQASAEKERALEQGVQNLVTARGQDISALTSAAELAKPSVAAYGQTVFNPLTGQYEGGGLGGTPDVNSLAQQVANGQMTPSKAESLLGGNIGLVSQLNKSILDINPNFNYVQAEARANATTADITQTGTIGGQLSKAAANATKAIGTLTNAYQKLSNLQKTQVPGFNQLLTNLSSLTGVGVAETQSYNTALQEARAAISSVLSAAGNTPTFSDATASSILPDGAGPQQLAAAVKTIEELIRQKESAFSGDSTVGASNTGNGGLFDW